MQSSRSPFFKKRLKWAEPKGFRKSDLKASYKSIFGIISLTASAFLCITYWFDLGAEATWNLLIAAGAIVVWDLGDIPTVYRFGAVDHCEIGNASVGGRTMSVLVVALKNGDRETFGVAPSVSTAVLRATLEQRGVSVVTRTDTISEQTLANENGDPYSHSTGT